VAHQNVRQSNVTVSDVLDSHLQIFFHILDHVSARDISAPVETHTDWERYRSLASDLIPPRIQIDTVEEEEKAASAFTASVASAYRLSTPRLTLPGLNNEPSGLDHETGDPACETAFNWVTKTIQRMTRRNAIERWETKISHSEVTRHAKSLMMRDRPQALTAIYASSSSSSSCLKFISL